jgi:arsenate reductase
MEEIIMWHKPNCSTSLETLALLKAHKIYPKIRNYLEDIPNEAELSDVIQKLGIKPFDLIRKKEPVFKTKYLGKTRTAKAWIKIMVKHPILIERPIIIKGNKAVMGRPPENALNINERMNPSFR